MSSLALRQRDLAKRTLSTYEHVCSSTVLMQFEQALWDEYGTTNLKGYRQKVTQVRAWFGSGAAQAYSSRMEAAGDVKGFVISVAEGHPDDSLLPPPQEVLSEQPTAAGSPSAVGFAQVLSQSHAGTAVTSPLAAGGTQQQQKPQSGLSQHQQIKTTGGSPLVLERTSHGSPPQQRGSQPPTGQPSPRPHQAPAPPQPSPQAPSGAANGELVSAYRERVDSSGFSGGNPADPSVSSLADAQGAVTGGYPERPAEPFIPPSIPSQWEPQTSYYQRANTGQWPAGKATDASHHTRRSTADREWQQPSSQSGGLHNPGGGLGLQLGGNDVEVQPASLNSQPELGESTLPRPLGEDDDPSTVDTHTFVVSASPTTGQGPAAPDGETLPIEHSATANEQSTSVDGGGSVMLGESAEASLPLPTGPPSGDGHDLMRGRIPVVSEVQQPPPTSLSPQHLQSMTVNFVQRRRRSSSSSAAVLPSHMQPQLYPQHILPQMSQTSSVYGGEMTARTPSDVPDIIGRDDSGTVARAVGVNEPASVDKCDSVAAEVEATRIAMAQYEATLKAVEALACSTKAGRMAWQQHRVQTETLDEALEIVQLLMKPHAERIRSAGDLVASLVRVMKDREAAFKEREEELLGYIGDLEGALDSATSEIEALATETSAIKVALTEVAEYAAGLEMPPAPPTPPTTRIHPPLQAAPNAISNESDRLTNNRHRSPLPLAVGTAATDSTANFPGSFSTQVDGAPTWSSYSTAQLPLAAEQQSVPAFVHAAPVASAPGRRATEFEALTGTSALPPPASIATTGSRHRLDIPAHQGASGANHVRSPADSVILEDVPDERRSSSPPMPWAGSVRPPQQQPSCIVSPETVHEPNLASARERNPTSRPAAVGGTTELAPSDPLAFLHSGNSADVQTAADSHRSSAAPPAGLDHRDDVQPLHGGQPVRQPVSTYGFATDGSRSSPNITTEGAYQRLGEHRYSREYAPPSRPGMAYANEVPRHSVQRWGPEAYPRADHFEPPAGGNSRPHPYGAGGFPAAARHHEGRDEGGDDSAKAFMSSLGMDPPGGVSSTDSIGGEHNSPHGGRPSLQQNQPRTYQWR